MATTTTEVPGADAAVHEAVRITKEAARQGTETAKVSLHVARSYVDEASLLGKEMFDTWAAEGESILRSGFDAQNASVSAGIAVFDLGVKTGKQSFEQAFRLLRDTQAATLESWQAAANAAAKAFEAPEE